MDWAKTIARRDEKSFGICCAFIWGFTVFSLPPKGQWVTLHGPLFTNRTDVLPQDLVKSRSRRDSCVDFSIYSEIWRAPRQQCCRDSCQVSERYDPCNIQSHGCETPRDLTVRRPSADIGPDYVVSVGRYKNGTCSDIQHSGWVIPIMMTSWNGSISALLALVWGIHQPPVNSPHKGQWRGTLMFPLICTWTNGWVKKTRRRWFETPSHPLWLHYNVSRRSKASF